MSYASDLIPPYKPTDLTVPYQQLKDLYDKYPIKSDDEAYKYVLRLLKRVFKECKREPSEEFTHRLYTLAYELLNTNHYFAEDLPAFEIAGKYTIDELKRWYAPGRLDATLESLFILIKEFLDHVAPEGAFVEIADTQKSISIALVDLMKTPRMFMHGAFTLLSALARDPFVDPLFMAAQDQLVRNILKVSGIKIDPRGPQNPHYIFPGEFPGTLQECAHAYFEETPLVEFLDCKIPFEISDSRFLEHAVLIAGSGHGKTQTLGALIARFVQRTTRPRLSYIDSTGALVKKIQHPRALQREAQRPHRHHRPRARSPPALNMFDISNPRVQSYSRKANA